jgi:hypothetical protein
MRFFPSALGRTVPRPSNVNLIFGLVVYLTVFAAAGLIGFIGFEVATATPTLIASEGIKGGRVACTSGIGLVTLSCISPFKPRGSTQNMIRWEEITRVSCVSRDGTVSWLQISAGTRRVEIGNLAVHDLGEVRAIILARAPKGTAEPCDSD